MDIEAIDSLCVLLGAGGDIKKKALSILIHKTKIKKHHIISCDAYNTFIQSMLTY